MRNIDSYIDLLAEIEDEQSLDEFLSSLTRETIYESSGLMVFKAISPTQQELCALGIMDKNLSAILMQYDICEQREFLYGPPKIVPAHDLDLTEKRYTDKSVMLVPINGKQGDRGYLAMLISSSMSDNHETRQLSWFWSVVAPYVYDAFKRVHEHQDYCITKRERECIKWASEGKTSWEISQILNISERTANFHLANCIQKTESVNRQQAIAKCLVQGHLSLS